MSEIKEKLKLIREGSSESELNISDDEVTSIISEAFLDISLYEAESIQSSLLETSSNDLSMSNIIFEAETATISKSTQEAKGVFEKMKKKLIRMKQSFDPYDGLRELKVTNQYIENKKMASRNIFWFGIIGVFIAQSKIASKYKNMPPNLINQYRDEALKFKRNLEKMSKKAESEGDKGTHKRLDKQIRNLQILIDVFENHVSNAKKKK